MAALAQRKLRVHGIVARQIGTDIVSGQLRPGHVLDGEVEASLRRKISRNTYRDAIRINLAQVNRKDLPAL